VHRQPHREQVDAIVWLELESQGIEHIQEESVRRNVVGDFYLF
jgi:hypothetical protein